MSSEIIVALISGGCALIGVIITNINGNKRMENQLRIAQAVTDTKIDELTREVREHNNFAQKMPVLQNEIQDLQRRVSNLEKYHQAPLN